MKYDYPQQMILSINTTINKTASENCNSIWFGESQNILFFYASSLIRFQNKQSYLMTKGSREFQLIDVGSSELMKQIKKKILTQYFIKKNRTVITFSEIKIKPKFKYNKIVLTSQRIQPVQ